MKRLIKNAVGCSGILILIGWAARFVQPLGLQLRPLPPKRKQRAAA